MTPRERLHQIVEEIPEAEIGKAERALARLIASSDRLRRLLDSAPWDDELESEEVGAAVAEAERDPSPSIPIEEIERELGLSR
jgi:hypothetical protein